MLKILHDQILILYLYQLFYEAEVNLIPTFYISKYINFKRPLHILSIEGTPLPTNQYSEASIIRRCRQIKCIKLQKYE